MSVTNNSIMFSVSSAVVEVVGGPTTAPTKLTNKLSRVTRGGANVSFILPSILSGEASEPMMLVNDTGSVVSIYPAAGEKINSAAANTPVTFGGGQSYMVFPSLNSPLVYPSPLNWIGNNFA